MLGDSLPEGNFHGCMGFKRVDRANLGPLMSDGSFTSEEHEQMVWVFVRRKIIRKKLNTIAQNIDRIHLLQGENWEMKLGAIEEDLDRLVEQSEEVE
jgi:hypothetical protein